MARKTKEEIRQMYDNYGADEAGMDRFIMEYYKETLGYDKFSKKILQLIMQEMKDNGMSIIEVIGGLAMAAATYVEALEGADCGKNIEDAFIDCFNMCRIVVKHKEELNEEDDN